MHPDVKWQKTSSVACTPSHGPLVPDFPMIIMHLLLLVLNLSASLERGCRHPQISFLLKAAMWCLELRYHGSNACFLRKVWLVFCTSVTPNSRNPIGGGTLCQSIRTQNRWPVKSKATASWSHKATCPFAATRKARWVISWHIPIMLKMSLLGPKSTEHRNKGRLQVPGKRDSGGDLIRVRQELHAAKGCMHGCLSPRQREECCWLWRFHLSLSLF